MALSKLEKRLLLTSLSFFYKYGEYFVSLAKGDKDDNQKLWQEARPILKQLFYRIKNK
jgi:hypothetical protein